MKTFVYKLNQCNHVSMAICFTVHLAGETTQSPQEEERCPIMRYMHLSYVQMSMWTTSPGEKRLRGGGGVVGWVKD